MPKIYVEYVKHPSVLVWFLCFLNVLSLLCLLCLCCVALNQAALSLAKAFFLGSVHIWLLKRTPKERDTFLYTYQDDMSFGVMQCVILVAYYKIFATDIEVPD